MVTSDGDRLGRHAGSLSRRASLLSIMALAVTAAGRESASAAEKAKNARRKRCKRQVAPCRLGVSAQCASAADPQACEAYYLTCCDFLARCRGYEAAQCFVQLC